MVSPGIRHTTGWKRGASCRKIPTGAADLHFWKPKVFCLSHGAGFREAVFYLLQEPIDSKRFRQKTGDPRLLQQFLRAFIRALARHEEQGRNPAGWR